MTKLSFTALVLASLSDPAFAAERALTGAEIESLLPTIAARGGNSYQTFEPNGTTDYFSGGNPSKGRWSIRGDKYCSVWPPVTEYRCYGVVLDEENKRIFWVEENGAREKNRYEPRQR